MTDAALRKKFIRHLQDAYAMERLALRANRSLMMTSDDEALRNALEIHVRETQLACHGQAG